MKSHFGNLNPRVPAYFGPANGIRRPWMPRPVLSTRPPQEPPLESSAPDAGTTLAATQDQGADVTSPWITLAQIALVPLLSLTSFFSRR